VASYTDPAARQLPEIDENSVLNLTMDHMRRGCDFETCTLADIRYSYEPAMLASKVVLRGKSGMRVLKPAVRGQTRIRAILDDANFVPPMKVRRYS